MGLEVEMLAGKELAKQASAEQGRIGDEAAELASTEADEVFAHLEALVDKLPLMQEKDACLSLAREARKIRSLKTRSSLLAAEIAKLARNKDRALRDAKAASEKGNAEAEGQNLALLRMYSDLHAARLASSQRADAALSVVLKQSALTLDDDLDALALTDEAYAALEAELLSFQADYKSTFLTATEF